MQARAPVPEVPHPELTQVRQEPRAEVTVEHLLARAIVVLIGFGIGSAGFMLMLSIFLVFIGLPMFIFGLAVMEVELKGWR